MLSRPFPAWATVFIGRIEPSTAVFPDAQIQAESAPLLQPNGTAFLTAIRAEPSTSNIQAIPRQRSKWAVRATLAIAFVAAASFFLARYRARPLLAETDSVVLADFDNSTSDPVFDEALKQAVSVQLLQSPFLNMLSDPKVNFTLRLMTKPPGTKLTPDIARDVCLRAGAKAYIAGSIRSLGSQYVVDLTAVDCQTGDTVAREESTADRKEFVLTALGTATTRLRKRLGESKFDTPIDEATTPSLEALSIGKKKQQVEGNGAAIPFFERAIELDPNFAAAYAALGTSYSNLREPELASQNLTRAYELRGKVSERERFRFSAYYYHLVTASWKKPAKSTISGRRCFRATTLRAVISE